MNPSQHAEQFQSQLANYVPQFTPEFWPVWLIIAGVYFKSSSTPGFFASLPPEA